MWSKYENLSYFITYFKFVYKFAVNSLFYANSKYADEFQVNMPLLYWYLSAMNTAVMDNMLTPPYWL